MKLQCLSILAATIVISSFGATAAFADATDSTSTQPLMAEVTQNQDKAQLDKEAQLKEMEWKIKEAQYQQKLQDLERENRKLDDEHYNATHHNPISSLVGSVAAGAGVALGTAGAIGLNGVTYSTYPTYYGYGYPTTTVYGGYPVYGGYGYGYGAPTVTIRRTGIRLF